MPTCIYCCVDQPFGQFSTEHVVNRAFGGFRNNLTMAPGDRPYVCCGCNQFFGDTIDAVDRTIARAIAKISFNYLAWYQGADFVLRTDFNDIRECIRWTGGTGGPS